MNMPEGGVKHPFISFHFMIIFTLFNENNINLLVSH